MSPLVTGNVTAESRAKGVKNPVDLEVSTGQVLPESGRPDSNRRRPAWEAGILPLNYARGSGEMLGRARGESSGAYFPFDASRKLRRSGSLTAGSPGDTL